MKLIWTDNAINNLETILSYLDLNWSEKVRKNFIAKLDNKIEQIKKFPESGIKTNAKTDLKKILITKHCYLVYKVKKNKILLINFKDTRQNSNGN